MITRKLSKECLITSKYLERTAIMWSFTYSTSIWVAIIINIFLLGNVIHNQTILFSIGAIGLIASLIPLVFQKKVEKVEGYNKLAAEFKNLSQDLESDKKSNAQFERKLKFLRKEMSNYPIGLFNKSRFEKEIMGLKK